MRKHCRIRRIAVPLLCALLGLAVTGLTVLPAMAGTPKPTKTE